MPHLHGNVFQSSTTECYLCDHAGTPGGGTFPLGTYCAGRFYVYLLKENKQVPH